MFVSYLLYTQMYRFKMFIKGFDNWITKCIICLMEYWYYYYTLMTTNIDYKR